MPSRAPTARETGDPVSSTVVPGRPGSILASETTGSVGAAVLFCDNCGKETLHRVLRLDRPTGGGPRRSVAGVARCRACRWTHRFLSSRARTVGVEVIVSRGAASERKQVEVPATERFQVGASLPEAGTDLRVQRIDRHDRRPASSAPADEVRTVWAVVDTLPSLRVAILQGARSTTERLAAPSGLRLTVSEDLRLPSGPVTIVALRARGHTWRRPGDAFPAEEVAVVYGRRTVSPPAGSRAWSRGRGTPRSRASSTSRAARSRSSPGVRRNRTAPRARTAAVGATLRNSSPS